MDLNDLIKKMGKDVLDATDLSIPPEVSNFDGFERFRKLERLSVNRRDIDVSLDPPPENEKVERTLREIYLRCDLGSIRIDDEHFLNGFSFLQRYKNLRKVTIFTDMIDCKSLSSETLEHSVEEMILRAKYIDLSGIQRYKKLKKLVIEGKEGFYLEDLDSDSLRATVTDFSLASKVGRAKLDFLQGYCLERLVLRIGAGIKSDEFKFFANSRMTKSLKELDFKGAEEFEDISVFANYQRLQMINFQGTTIRNIDTLLDHVYVRNGSLKEITLPDTINWSNFDNGRAILGLRKRGVKVNVPREFHYEEQEIEGRSKLYVIVAPPGAGKSTLMRLLEKEYKIKPLRKVTTRPYRPGEDSTSKDIVSISEQEFRERLRRGDLVMHRQRFQNSYGTDLLEFVEAYHSRGRYMVDRCSPEPALRLQRDYPEFVEIIIFEPTPELVEYGLIRRYNQFARCLDKPDKGFSSIDEEIKYLTALRQNIVDVKRRMLDIPDYVAKLRPYERFVNHYIRVANYQELRDQVRQIFKGIAPQPHL